MSYIAEHVYHRGKEPEPHRETGTHVVSDDNEANSAEDLVGAELYSSSSEDD